jgi:hypothetical protein
MRLAARPIIYEINTWVWLNELGRRAAAPVTLATVPAAAWDAVAPHGADAVWLMGVWERSPAGIAAAMGNAGLLEGFRRALPDFEPTDNVGSPYCVRRYAVDPRLGGAAGLAAARTALAQRGMGLVLDFVPNHVAPDHPWTSDHPEYFIPGSAAEREGAPDAFLEAGGRVFACGRDPFFPAWPDVLQLNAFHPGLRRAAADTLLEIADCCDGVRCDMAMLVMNSVFAGTWGERAGPRPESEYWPPVIAAVKARHPHFVFIAEAYWDLEWELQQQGFDFCYDKRLYDRLEREGAETVRLHLRADPAYQERLVRFIENHDEPRAAAAFAPDRLRAAAVAALTLPGAKLVHEGQMEGRRVRLPVFLGRRPTEAPDAALEDFHRRLLRAVGAEVFQRGAWQLCECGGWPDNQSCRHLLAWSWRFEADRRLVVVNYADRPSQGLVRIAADEFGGRPVVLEDLLSGERYERQADAMARGGLYVDLPPWGFHLFAFRGAAANRLSRGGQT